MLWPRPDSVDFLVRAAKALNPVRKKDRQREREGLEQEAEGDGTGRWKSRERRQGNSRAAEKEVPSGAWEKRGIS